jgi:hypothetical protein
MEQSPKNRKIMYFGWIILVIIVILIGLKFGIGKSIQKIFVVSTTTTIRPTTTIIPQAKLTSSLRFPGGYGVSCVKQDCMLISGKECLGGNCTTTWTKSPGTFGGNPVSQIIDYYNVGGIDLKDMNFQLVCYKISGGTMADISDRITYKIYKHSGGVITDKPVETYQATEVFYLPKGANVEFEVDLEPTAILALGRLAQDNDNMKVQCHVQFYSTTTPVVVEDNFQYEITVKVVTSS